MSRRPWRVDTFDLLKAKWFQRDGDGRRIPAYRRAIMFVDNAGADVVLGMMPLARELLREGTEVVMVANLLPAINDVTASELKTLVKQAAAKCHIIRDARRAAIRALSENGGKVPHPAGVMVRKSSSDDLIQCTCRQSGRALPAFCVVPLLCAFAIKHTHPIFLYLRLIANVICLQENSSVIVLRTPCVDGPCQLLPENGQPSRIVCKFSSGESKRRPRRPPRGSSLRNEQRSRVPLPRPAQSHC